MSHAFWSTVRSKTVSPNSRHLRATLEIHDDSEDWIVDGGPPPIADLTPIAGVSCIIEYANASGEGSQRLVSCQRIDRHGSLLYLWAYCHSRGNVRQFRIDRIKAIFDPETGEQHSNVDEFFAAFAIDRHQQSVVGWGLSVAARANLIAYMNALVFLAKCDRQFHVLERDALEAAICSFWLRMEHPGDPDCAAIMAYVDRLAPDAETFWLAMHRCIASPIMIMLLKRAAQSMIEADGRITAEEFYWGSEIDQFLADLTRGQSAET